MAVQTPLAWRINVVSPPGHVLLEWGGIAESKEDALRKAESTCHDTWMLLSSAYRKVDRAVPSNMIGEIVVVESGQPIWALEYCRLTERYFDLFNPYENVARGRPIRQKDLAAYLEQLLKIDPLVRAHWIEGDEPLIYARSMSKAHPMRMFIQTDTTTLVTGGVRVLSEPVRYALRLLAFHKCCGVRSDRMDSKTAARLRQPASAVLRASLKMRDPILTEAEYLPVVSYFQDLGLSGVAAELESQAKIDAFIYEYD